MATKAKKANSDKTYTLNNAPSSATLPPALAEKYKQISRPPILKLADLADNEIVWFTPMRLVDSFNKKINSKLILATQFRLEGDKHVEIGVVTIPTNKSLMNSITDEAGDLKYTTQVIGIYRTGYGDSKNYVDDNGKPKKFAKWNVLAEVEE